MSGQPNIKGNIQLPKPPIIAGITIKKIIKIAWEVITLLYNCPLSKKTPGLDNSKRIITEREEPSKPDQKPKIKYKLPISL